MNDQVSAEASTRGRVTGLFITLIASELLLLMTWWYTAYYWTLPVAAIATLAVLAAATGLLFVLVVSKAKRKIIGLLVTLVLVAVIAVAFMVGSIFFPGSLLPREGRVRQIADEAELAILLPLDREIEAHDRWGYEPSSMLSEDGVFSIDYGTVNLSEQSSDSVLTVTELEDFVDIEQPESGSPVTLTVGDPVELEVLGSPAIAVTYNENVGAKGAQPSSTILVFQPDGMVAWLVSSPESGLATDDLVRIAESLEPLD
jgi:hypothetical protein